MGIFNKIFRRKSKHRVFPPSLAKDLKAISALYTHDPYKSIFDYMDEYRSHIWVYASVFEIASSASIIPLKIYAEVEGDQKEIIDTELNDILRRPNPWQSGIDFRELHFIFMETAGMSFWYLLPERPDQPLSPLNPPKEIYLLRPDRVEIIPDRELYIREYIYRLNGQEITIDRDKVLMFKYSNPVDDYNGQSPMEAARLGVTGDREAQLYNINFFKNAFIPDGMFFNDNEFTASDESFNRLKAQLKDAFSGKKSRTTLIADGYKFQETRKNQKDMEFSDFRKGNKSEIAGAYGVPLSLIGDREAMNRATSETEERQFYEKTIIPKLKKFEECLNLNFVFLFGNYSVRHDLSGIGALSYGFEEKIGALVEAAGGKPIITVNEARNILSNILNKSLEPLKGMDELPESGGDSEVKDFEFFIKKKEQLERKSIGSGSLPGKKNGKANIYDLYKTGTDTNNGKS